MRAVVSSKYSHKSQCAAFGQNEELFTDRPKCKETGCRPKAILLSRRCMVAEAQAEKAVGTRSKNFLTEAEMENFLKAARKRRPSSTLTLGQCRSCITTVFGSIVCACWAVK